MSALFDPGPQKRIQIYRLRDYPWLSLSGVAAAEAGFVWGIKETATQAENFTSISDWSKAAGFLGLCITLRLFCTLHVEYKKIKVGREKIAGLMQHFTFVWQNSKSLLYRGTMYRDSKHFLTQQLKLIEEGFEARHTLQLGLIQIGLLLPFFYFVPVGLIYGLGVLGLPVIVLSKFKIGLLDRIYTEAQKAQQRKGLLNEDFLRKMEWMIGNGRTTVLLEQFVQSHKLSEYQEDKYKKAKATLPAIFEWFFFGVFLTVLILGVSGILGVIEKHELLLFSVLLFLLYRPIKEVLRFYPTVNQSRLEEKNIVNFFTSLKTDLTQKDKLSEGTHKEVLQQKETHVIDLPEKSIKTSSTQTADAHKLNSSLYWNIKHMAFRYSNTANTQKINPLLWPPFEIDIPCPARVCLWGANGSGKTTFLRLIAKIEPTTEFLLNSPLQEDNKGFPLAYLPQKIELWPLSPCLPSNLNPAQKQELWEILGLGFLENHIYRGKEALCPPDLRNPWNIELPELSTGQKQRLGIYQALLQNQPLILLDEPTQGLPLEEGRVIVKNLLAWQNQTGTKSLLLISSHDPEIMHLCDWALKFEKNKAPFLTRPSL